MFVYTLIIDWQYDDMTVRVCGTYNRALSEARAIAEDLYEDDMPARMSDEQVWDWFLDNSNAISATIAERELLQ